MWETWEVKIICSRGASEGKVVEERICGKVRKLTSLPRESNYISSRETKRITLVLAGQENMRRSWKGSLRKMMLIVRKSDQVPSIKQSTEAWNQWRDDDCSLVGH